MIVEALSDQHCSLVWLVWFLANTPPLDRGVCNFMSEFSSSFWSAGCAGLTLGFVSLLLSPFTLTSLELCHVQRSYRHQAHILLLMSLSSEEK